MINKTEWLQSGGLLYRLTNGSRPENTDEINVTMADGSRSVDACALRATELLAALAQPDEAPEGCTPADAMVLREANHALAMELHEAKAALARQGEPVAWIQPICRYISGVLAGDAAPSEKHIARTIMHRLPLDASLSDPAPVAQPLTDERIDTISDEVFDLIDGIPDDLVGSRTWDRMFARAIERAHKIGGPL